MKRNLLFSVLCLLVLAACGSSGTTVPAGVNKSGAALVSIAVSPSIQSLPLNQTLLFTATGTYSDGTTSDLTSSVTWTSSNISIADVENAADASALLMKYPVQSVPGRATALVVGTVTITATDPVTGKTATATLISGLLGGGVQGNTLVLANAVSTLAGQAGIYGSADGTGSAASFVCPDGLTTDGTNLYVADSCSNTIRKVVISTGEVTTIAGSAGQVGSTDGTGSAARFSTPPGITTDGTNLYVADNANSTSRKVVISTGEVTTIAGSAGQTGSTDGTGSAARFKFPSGITTDRTNLYVTDNGTIRKVVISTGEVTTIAGSAGQTGSTDGTGSAAMFVWPYGITTDGENLYVADYSNYNIREIVISTGEVTTIAGSAGQAGFTDGTGTAARFDSPLGITTDGANVFVADEGNATIRRIK